MQRRPKRGDDLQAIQPAREIVVRHDHVRPDRAPHHQRQRSLAIGGYRRAVAVALEQEVEHLADGRIILDDEDRAAVAGKALAIGRANCNGLALGGFAKRHLDGEDGALAGP